MDEKLKIEPQPGPQTLFLSTHADIAIYGGAAGGGKSWALLVEPLRHYNNSKFGSVCFRRTTKQVRNEGGLWDEAMNIYAPLHAEPKSSSLEFQFPTGMRCQFAHLEYEKNVHDWQGSQIPLIMFDELTHFSEAQFFYMLSRNRSTSRVPGYVRATCNADSGSWVRRLIDWWIGSDGYPIPERVGVIRWFIRRNDELHWADSKQELLDQFGPDVLPKSLTFIPAKLEDNPILMEKDPAYKANLDALPYVERMRLKEGNWNVKAQAGTVFKKEWFEIVQAIPQAVKSIRYWDRAATEPNSHNKDPDWTVGLKLIRDQLGLFYIEDITRLRGTPLKVQDAIQRVASQDGTKTTIYLELDPGQAGIAEQSHYSRLLSSYEIKFNRVNKDKITRSKIASAQAEAGNIKLLEGKWNTDFITECANFPDAAHDDQVDTLSGAINIMTESIIGTFTEAMTESDSIPIIDSSLDW